MLDKHEPTDEDLMLMAQAGSVESFEVLVSRHRMTVIRFLIKMHEDIDLAEDACQEAFLRLWVHKDQYATNGKFTAYLLQIAKRVLLGRLRGRKVISLDEAGLIDAADNVNPLPDYAAMDAERTGAAVRCVDDLPPHLSAVFRAVVLDGMKYAEAAEHLNIPIGTVKSRMHEAVKRLRTALSEEGLL